jgi:hypothetical protein
MQSARDQQVEIRDESAEPRHVLGPADQRLVRRIVLVDNRRTVLSAIIYNDVDLIAAEPRILDSLVYGLIRIVGPLASLPNDR